MVVGAEDEPGLKLTEPDAVSRSPAETAFLPRPPRPSLPLWSSLRPARAAASAFSPDNACPRTPSRAQPAREPASEPPPRLGFNLRPSSCDGCALETSSGPQAPAYRRRIRTGRSGRREMSPRTTQPFLVRADLPLSLCTAPPAAPTLIAAAMHGTATLRGCAPLLPHQATRPAHLAPSWRARDWLGRLALLLDLRQLSPLSLPLFDSSFHRKLLSTRRLPPHDLARAAARSSSSTSSRRHGPGPLDRPGRLSCAGRRRSPGERRLDARPTLCRLGRQRLPVRHRRVVGGVVLAARKGRQAARQARRRRRRPVRVLDGHRQPLGASLSPSRARGARKN